MGFPVFPGRSTVSHLYLFSIRHADCAYGFNTFILPQPRIKPNEQFSDNKAMIILTGSTGFLGSALLQKLLEREDEVIAIKRSTSSTARLSHCLGNPRLRMLDIDLEDPLKCFEECRIDTIIHTATEYGRGMTPLRNIINANILLPL
jgi:hypothetical protein